MIALTTVVYFLTWPAEKRYYLAHVPGGELNVAAGAVADMALQDPSLLPPDLFQRLQKDRKEALYPTPRTDALLKEALPLLEFRSFVPKPVPASPFERAAGIPLMGLAPSSPSGEPQNVPWKNAYERYRDARRESMKKGVPDSSVFDRFGFQPSHGWWPGILTSIFLHAGFFHLFFNMLFLWIVGCGIEERWGAPLFLGVYFVGGALADLVQYHFQNSDMGSVGASGAVAAVMGAFLVRHYKMPLRMFYFVWIWIKPKFGTFFAPAWTVLLLWLAEQLFWALMTEGHQGGVAYWAHVGGFGTGTLMGLLISGWGLAQSQETAAERAEGGIRLKLEEAETLSQEGRPMEAWAIHESVLAENPEHGPTLLGAYRVLTQMNDGDGVGRWAPRILRAAAREGRFDVVNEMAVRWRGALAAQAYSDGELLGIARAYESSNRTPEAVQTYERLLRDHPATPYRGKAVFSLGRLYGALKRSPDARRCFEFLLRPPFDMEWGPSAEAELQRLPPP